MAPLPPPPPPPPRLPPPAPPGPSGSIHRATYDHEVSRWGIGDALLSMALFFTVSIAIGFVAYFAIDGTVITGFWLPAVVAVPPLIQLGHVTWIARARGAGLSRDLGLQVKFGDVAVGAALCVAGLILAGITASLIFELFDQEPTASAAELVEDSEGGNGLTIWIYVFAFLAATLIPLVEELVYRGLWWSALEKRGMHPVVILVLTSGIFALVHLEPVRTPVLFMLGLAIGLGRLVTGRIGASIAAHMYVNAIGMIFLLIDLS
ncbi:MAG: type II CAAX endopeptidase family protein [Acidimicrobiales bacterium]